jgi:predicted RNA-binding protein YlxR (DUF448 family)
MPVDLVRIALTAEGQLALGTGLPGRGAWLCRGIGTLFAPNCLETAIRRQAFARAFRAPVSAEAAEALRAEGTKRAKIEDGRA